MSKRYFLWFVMGIFFAGMLVNFVSASPYNGLAWSNGLSFDEISRWSNWTDPSFLIRFTVYFLAPLLFIYLVIYGFLEDANIFDTAKINAPLALMLALMAIPTGILSRLIWFISQFAVLGAVIIFFSIFVLYLSHRYRKKALEYNYILGSKFLTQLLIHSPILFFSTLAGLELGIIYIGNDNLLSPGSADVLVSIVTGIFFGVIAYRFINYRNAATTMERYIGPIVAAIIGYLISPWGLNYIFKNNYTVHGAIIGFGFGMLWVGLGMIAHGREASRIRDIMSSNKEEAKEYTALRIVKDALAQRTKMECKEYADYLKRILNKNKELLNKYGLDEYIKELPLDRLCDEESLPPPIEKTILALEKMLDLKIKQLEDSMDATTNLLLMRKREYK